MARATLNTVRRIVYENLGVTTNGAYGTLLTNERYPTGYIDDKIAEADISTVQLLFKNKQMDLLSELYTTQNVPTTGTLLNQNWIIVDVDVVSSVREETETSGTQNAGIELDFNEYVKLNAGNIFDVAAYQGYYTIRKGKIYFRGDSAVVTYINLTHATSLATLFSPSGFEGPLANLASSLLLMKRGDKPEQAKYYLGLYEEFMKQFMVEDSNAQLLVNS